MRWLIGKCTGCGRDIIRRHPDKAQSCSTTVSSRCSCVPRLEVAKKYIADGSVLVIWDERDTDEE